MVVAARQTDSGHHSVEEADMLAELPAGLLTWKDKLGYSGTPTNVSFCQQFV